MTNDKIEKTRSKYTPNNKIMDENGEKFFVEMLLTKDKICPFMAKDSKSFVTELWKVFINQI